MDIVVKTSTVDSMNNYLLRNNIVLEDKSKIVDIVWKKCSEEIYLHKSYQNQNRLLKERIKKLEDHIVNSN